MVETEGIYNPLLSETIVSEQEAGVCRQSGSSGVGVNITGRRGSQKVPERKENPSRAEPLLTPLSVFWDSIVWQCESQKLMLPEKRGFHTGFLCLVVWVCFRVFFRLQDVSWQSARKESLTHHLP